MLGMRGQLGDLPALATAFVIVAITIALGSVILSEFRTATLDNGSATNATEAVDKGQEGINQLSTFLPIIGLVAAASIVLTIVRKLI